MDDSVGDVGCVAFDDGVLVGFDEELLDPFDEGVVIGLEVSVGPSEEFSPGLDRNE